MAGAPIIDGRDRAAILAALKARLPGYLPEWQPAPGTPGHAFLTVLARTLELEAEGLDGMPERERFAFLDTLGNSLQPAQSSRAPIVFTLMPTAPLDVTLPARTQVAAKLPPPPPSLAGVPAPAAPPAPLFFVEQTVSLTRARLGAVYSVDPDADTYREHTSELATGFTVLDRMEPVQHAIYFGHDTLFRLAGDAEIVLSFNLAPARGLGTSRPLLVDWEYFSVNGWLPLTLREDETARLTTDGRITLRKNCGPDAKEETFANRKSYWIRGVVSARTPTALIGPLPGGYRLLVGPPPLLATTPTVTVDGVAAVAIDAVAGRTITLPKPLDGAAPFAVLLQQGTGAFVAEIARLADSLNLVFVGVDPGRVVTIDGTTFACVVGADDQTAVLSQPLEGAIVGATILDAVTGNPLGTVLEAGSREFTVPVEDGREFLEGDVVTIDATSRATITSVTRPMLELDGPIAGAAVGERLILADGLPPLRHEGADEAGTLPEIDVVLARVGFSKTGLAPESAYVDSSPLDVGNTFKPFGAQPEKFTTFYVASKETFQRGGASVALHFTIAAPGKGYADNGAAGVGPSHLDWRIEYFNGTVWLPLNEQHDLVDETVRLTAGAARDVKRILFRCPYEWQEGEINGEKNFWLRIRIENGNYGHPLRISVTVSGGQPSVQADPDTLAPPVVTSLTLQYTYHTNPTLPDHCLTFNDFAFSDHTEDARWPRSPFAPFVAVSDPTPALHLGFTHKLPVGLVSLFVVGVEDDDDRSPVSPFLWEYLGARGWTEFPIADETAGFTRTGMLQFIGAPDAVKRDGLGGPLYRVRARLKPGARSAPLTLGGVWLNGVWARQGESFANETIGTSNGNPVQTFVFPPQRVPVMAGEVLEVREWSGRGDDWETAVLGAAPEDLRFEVDPRDARTPTAVWVRWHERPHLLSSAARDRHYSIERASGVVRFGAPPFGMIPPAGARIVVSYTAGGGLLGNVPAGTIIELRSGVGYVQSVTNPLPAAGGAATELTLAGRDRATARLAHRDRAVSASDFEWLAREASPEVARVRALPIEGAPGTPLRGWVTLLVVPHSTEPAPWPVPELGARVLAHIRSRCPIGVSPRVRIVPPVYLAISVQSEIVVRTLDAVGYVEARVREQLARFLHPLTGGSASRGFAFGEAVYLSDVAALLEAIEGVDFVRHLILFGNGAVQGDVVRVPPDALPVAGDHQLKLLVRGR